MSYPAIHPMTDRNLVGLCHIDWVDVEDIDTWPDEIDGNLIGDIELLEGKTWNRVELEDDTGALFREVWRLVEGVQHSEASITGDVAKDRLALMPRLWELKGKRCVARMTTRNGDTLVMGTQDEPAVALVKDRTTGQDVDSDRNQYAVEIAVSRRLPVPWYQGVVEEAPPAPIDCLPVLVSINGDLMQVAPSGSAVNLTVTTNGTPSGAPSGSLSWDTLVPTSLCDMIEDALLENGTVGIRLTAGTSSAIIPQTGLTNSRPSGTIADWNGGGETATYQWNGSAWRVAIGSDIWSSTEDVATPGDVTTWTGGPPSITVINTGPMLLMECLTTEQRTQLLTALVQAEAWSVIETLLTEEQMADAIASLGGSGSMTLCEAIDAALNSVEEEGMVLTIGGDNAVVPRTGTVNGRPSYVIGVWPGTGFTLDILWDGSQWSISDGVDSWTSSEDVPMPHLVTTWDPDGEVSIEPQGPLHPAVLLGCLTGDQGDDLFEYQTRERPWSEVQGALSSGQLDDAEAAICAIAPANVLHEYTSSGTFTKPTSPLFKGLWVFVAGAGGSGGAGGGDGSSVTGGAGGGGGAGTRVWIPAASIASTETYTVGAGGASVSSGNGNAGGDSSFGSLATAKGGSGGAASNGAGPLTGAAGGSGAASVPGFGSGSDSGNSGGTGSRNGANTAGGVGMATFAGAGGGGAGGINVGTAFAGTAGGGCYNDNTLTTGGTAGAIATNAGNGISDVALELLTGLVANTIGFGTGGGAGGGAVGGANGGRGGNGGRGCGGGGGGGCAKGGTPGPSGSGGNGFILVYEVYSNN